jgi:cytochrome c peroxidase
LCGAFKVPTLRNVGKTAPNMHNGYFTGLREVVEFYVTRETNPSKWYPSASDGTVQKYDDLPAEYHGNVNTEEVPYDRKLGEEPRLTASEIDAVVAFLRTLSDGYGEHGYLPETN